MAHPPPSAQSNQEVAGGQLKLPDEGTRPSRAQTQMAGHGPSGPLLGAGAAGAAALAWLGCAVAGSGQRASPIPWFAGLGAAGRGLRHLDQLTRPER